MAAVQAGGGPVHVEESRAKRIQRQQSRFRDRGGIFVPSTKNTLVDILLARSVTGESPRKVKPKRAQDRETCKTREEGDGEVQEVTGKKPRKITKKHVVDDQDDIEENLDEEPVAGPSKPTASRKGKRKKPSNAPPKRRGRPPNRKPVDEHELDGPSKKDKPNAKARSGKRRVPDIASGLDDNMSGLESEPEPQRKRVKAIISNTSKTKTAKDHHSVDSGEPETTKEGHGKVKSLMTKAKKRVAQRKPRSKAPPSNPPPLLEDNSEGGGRTLPPDTSRRNAASSKALPADEPELRPKSTAKAKSKEVARLDDGDDIDVDADENCPPPPVAKAKTRSKSQSRPAPSLRDDEHDTPLLSPVPKEKADIKALEFLGKPEKAAQKRSRPHPDDDGKDGDQEDRDKAADQFPLKPKKRARVDLKAKADIKATAKTKSKADPPPTPSAKHKENKRTNVKPNQRCKGPPPHVLRRVGAPIAATDTDDEPDPIDFLS